ncbi:MAG: NUDIX hydrolase [Candidatus Vogelbacteria bacterium]|nr:NUDIX hydrolase [Candidatus Vogelbacteria bacterium]
MNFEIPKCYYRVSVKALILDETRKKFLIVQEDNGRWELPGGGLDWGENAQDAIRREVREEMGLEVTYVAKQPAYFLSDRDDKKVYVNVIFETQLRDLNFTPSNECVAIKFVLSEEVKTMNTFQNVQIFAIMFDALDK